MVNTCCICGCRAGFVSLFCFPAVKKNVNPEQKHILTKRRAAWINIAKKCRKLNVTKLHNNYRICEKHFITGQPSHWLQVDHPDWTPTVFTTGTEIDSDSIAKSNSKILRYERKKTRESVAKKQQQLREMKSNVEVFVEPKEIMPLDSVVLPTEAIQPTQMAGTCDLLYAELATFPDENSVLRNKITELRKEVDRLHIKNSELETKVQQLRASNSKLIQENRAILLDKISFQDNNDNFI